MKVLYAGSLAGAMTRNIAPSFRAATGYELDGYPGGSEELASLIRGGIRQADVFISASASVDRQLRGKAGGGWVSAYKPFAESVLKLGYNPKSPFARLLRTTPWYQVAAMPGFRLGMTDPKLDPKGILADQVLKAAADSHHENVLSELANEPGDEYPEEALLGRLQTGQVDAGFFYSVEAKAASVPTVTLGSASPVATYTVAVLNRAPDRAGARALEEFLLGNRGRSALRRAGLVPKA